MSLSLQSFLIALLVAMALGQRAGPRCNKRCEWNLWGHYVAKGCTPDFNCCPNSFTCPKLEPSPNQCRYKGVTYNLRDRVSVTDPCSASCRCDRSFGLNPSAKIECANVECPEFFGVIPPPAPGCRRVTKPGDCCSSDTVCDVGKPRTPVCQWGNQTYFEGDYMEFGEDFPCRSCTCGPDFTNPLGPGCQEIECGFDFRYVGELERGCTPIYFEEDGCCPIDWVCPGDSRIRPSPPAPSNLYRPVTAAKCYLGQQQFDRGTVIDLGREEIVCGCKTPPDLTCIQYRSSELARRKNYFGRL